MSEWAGSTFVSAIRNKCTKNLFFEHIGQSNAHFGLWCNPPDKDVPQYSSNKEKQEQ